MVNVLYVNRGKARLPALKVQKADGTTDVYESNSSKAQILQKGFFLVSSSSARLPANFIYPPPKFTFDEISDAEVIRAIEQLSPYKAPGISGIMNIVLLWCKDLLAERLACIYRATFKLDVYPEEWKKSVSVVLRKLGKADYSAPNAYQPVTLLELLSKPLSKCVANTLSYYTEKLGLLPVKHYGGRLGRMVTDALHTISHSSKRHGGKEKLSQHYSSTSKGHSQMCRSSDFTQPSAMWHTQRIHRLVEAEMSWQEYGAHI
jgi:hypothetical protein